MDDVDAGRIEDERVEAYSRRAARGAEALRESLRDLDEERCRAVGSLEESLVASLSALRGGFPSLERHMFVFPSSLMPQGSEALRAARAVVRSDEVVLLCRHVE